MVELDSPCKVNLVLNILGRRADGFHELETLMLPVPVHDRLRFAEAPSGIELTCSDSRLPVDGSNLVHRAASAFLAQAGISKGVAIHLEKRIPMAAGLGGGSGNAATTLLGLNRLFDSVLSGESLNRLAQGLGSDVPFFLQDKPALAVGRGEQVRSLAPFSTLQGCGLLLVHPGFGISTPWAYQQLARFPQVLRGQPGRAQQLADALQAGRLADVGGLLFNSLEAPALEKYPILGLYQDRLSKAGALGRLMSGSGSSTFALFAKPDVARKAEVDFKNTFTACWTAVVTL